MFATKQDIFLKLSVFDLVVLDKHVLANNLNRVLLFVNRVLSQEHFAECPAA
jgi:hypothetical protein